MQQTESSQELAPVRFEITQVPINAGGHKTGLAFHAVGTGLAVQMDSECKYERLVNAHTGAAIRLENPTYPFDVAFKNFNAAERFVRAVAAKVGWVESRGFPISAYCKVGTIETITQVYQEVPETDRYGG